MKSGQKKKGIVSFDLDMTLLDHRQWKIPDSAMEALRLLRENYLVVLATGRDMDNNYSREFKEKIKPDAIIHMNGTKITADGKEIYCHTMERELLKELLTYADRHHHSVGFTMESEDYYVNPEGVAEHDRNRWGMSERNFQDWRKMLEMPVRTLAYIGNPEGAADIRSHFPQIRVLLFAGGQGADLVELEASKGQGLLRLCQYYGIDIQDTWAFGDSMNDLEIIQTAGTGIAMGNAMEELKAHADYVTDDIGEDGVWNACKKLGLI